ncbi:DUF4333 domain-containing protein [Nocardioides dongkuii]|uniref:DUF4333 domain-containing protein n=1 Tax=Nocardioides dongkuii TaxID=2760089 RepID=UPI001C6FFC08|nr:DUF4333 domain-containing protein [Nocardioides dongkuii]
MRTPPHRQLPSRLAGLAAVAATVATLSTGCSAEVSAGGSAMSEGQVEDLLMEKITEEAGQEPDDVDCPDDLDAEVGATMTCTLTAGTDTLDIDVEVTSVEGDDLRFDYEIGQINEPAEGGA